MNARMAAFTARLIAHYEHYPDDNSAPGGPHDPHDPHERWYILEPVHTAAGARFERRSGREQLES